MKYNYIDLFSGIGGFALGAHWAGMKFEDHFFSEVEKYAVKLYQLRFPGAIPLGDITKVDWEELKNKYPGEWILTGGFPCQDISVAGKGVGIHGERSGLWFEFADTIRILQPRFTIIENVGALLSRGMADVLGSLAEIGYDAEWQDIRAEDVGAPHRRERIWIVTYPHNDGRGYLGQQKVSGAGLSEKASQCLHQEMVNSNDGQLYSQQKKFRKKNGKQKTDGLTGCGQNKMENSRHLQGRSKEKGILRGVQRDRQECNQTIGSSQTRKLAHSPEPGLQRQESKRRDGREPRLPTKCDWWNSEPNVGRLADGIPNRVDRLKGLGNAIVPQIAQLLFELIKPYMEKE